MIYLLLFLLDGIIYYGMELAFNGASHPVMIIVGGICGIIIGLLNEYKFTWSQSFFKQVLIGLLIVMPIELVSGLILNIWLDMAIWDYSHLPLNIMGQTCVVFMPVFIIPVIVAILFDDYFRYWFMGEEKPHYNWRW